MQTLRDALVIPPVVSPLFSLTSEWQAAKLWKGLAKKALWRRCWGSISDLHEKMVGLGYCSGFRTALALRARDLRKPLTQNRRHTRGLESSG